MDFSDRPFIAIWETTQACDLACAHCRASAQCERDDRELSTTEARGLLDSFAKAHVPLVVLTGGDPAKRPDLVELIEYGTSIGLNMGLTPSATPLVTEELIQQLAQAGLKRLAISVDGANAEVHEAFRGVVGSFEHSLRILANANAHGIATQVNTSIVRSNIDQLEPIAALVRETKSVLWSVFFVVPTGRAESAMIPGAERVEEALNQLADIAGRERFGVKTTAAPHYRRILLQRKKARGESAAHGTHGPRGVRVNDGRGFVFVSHRGEVFPSGFLPRPCGDVRSNDVIDIYRTHPVFRALRDPSALTGKCGVCEYRSVCGGSRARAYATTGSLVASDSLCAYLPPNFTSPTDEPRRLQVV